MKTQLEINWLINLACNFKCPYCFTAKQYPNPGEKDIEKIVAGFDRLGKRCLINISGGEPFLYPRFVGLCSRLVKKHIISVNTNLSRPEVYEFADTLDPRRVLCIHASIHIKEKERLGLVEDFIEKYHYFEKKGFSIFASYILYPPFLKRFKKDYEFFKSRGIVIHPKLFRGELTRPGSSVKTKRYPEAYSSREKAFILDCMKKSDRDAGFKAVRLDGKGLNRFLEVRLDARFIDGQPDFSGKLCGAGKTYLYMLSNGDVFRCHSEQRYFGNLFLGDEITLFKKPVPCRSKECDCPYIGYRHIQQRAGA